MYTQTYQKVLAFLFLAAIQYRCQAQVSPSSLLFTELKKQDSLLFTRGFNQCDTAYLKKSLSQELRFYHDQSGIQDKNAFMENTQRYICADAIKKPIRKVDEGSVVVYPLYANGNLYGAIQSGVHHFYIREAGKNDIWTSMAQFTHVWLLREHGWVIESVLSYNHQSSR